MLYEGVITQVYANLLHLTYKVGMPGMLLFDPAPV
jgi:hypothetical protein